MDNNTTTIRYYIRLTATHRVGPFRSPQAAAAWSTTPLPAGSIIQEIR